VGNIIFALMPFVPGRPITGLAFASVAPPRLNRATGTPRRRDGVIYQSVDDGISWSPLGSPDVLFDPTAITTLGTDVFIADRPGDLQIRP
jgi:hypothetical protein